MPKPNGRLKWRKVWRNGHFPRKRHLAYYEASVTSPKPLVLQIESVGGHVTNKAFWLAVLHGWPPENDKPPLVCVRFRTLHQAQAWADAFLGDGATLNVHQLFSCYI